MYMMCYIIQYMNKIDHYFYFAGPPVTANLSPGCACSLLPVRPPVLERFIADYLWSLIILARFCDVFESRRHKSFPSWFHTSRAWTAAVELISFTLTNSSIFHSTLLHSPSPPDCTRSTRYSRGLCRLMSACWKPAEFSRETAIEWPCSLGNQRRTDSYSVSMQLVHSTAAFGVDLSYGTLILYCLDTQSGFQFAGIEK